eukprot:TRINITY_DN16676_c0_g1_i1.p1 TRINITY_DN16676_c0_g1~~TRINITY_DN16676_c0_g1_i1.p1  ORF type:complete len:385 (+),score=71.46 TRINITY_DN16676_c0_g1_i1:162-1157(+)
MEEFNQKEKSIKEEMKQKEETLRNELAKLNDIKQEIQIKSQGKGSSKKGALELTKGKKYAYVYYSTDTVYIKTICVTFYRLLNDLGMDKSIDLVLLYSKENVPEDLIKKMNNVGVKTIDRENINIINHGYYKNVLLKMYAFELEEYDRIIYIDGDSIMLHNADELFNLPEEIELASPWAYWENEPCMNGQFLVIKPSKSLFENRIKKWLNNDKIKNTLQREIFDMDIINLEWEHREFLDNKQTCRILPEVLMLPSHYCIVERDFLREDHIQKLQKTHLKQGFDRLLEIGKVVHIKPWIITLSQETANPALKKIMDIWREGVQNVCTKWQIC